ncbi:Rha family transcriptional regulator [Diaphorobacter sp. HDW4A]|uniref:Rha family transcriptional regulator n=1 Tax=Diaphorobacter sp. HDW4A TaxID=2714924 RepID=UPI00140C7371|nr:Rha family transcriptional regulator [Diaphorobacter sp. HDW4A]QIL80791.1 Rha family transcriptional regulator [Diaphorobacter sp. HDW4A]
MSHSALAFVPSLAVVDGKPTTTSIDVVRHFGKQHRNVLQAIQNLIPQLDAEHALNFQQMVVDVQIGSGATRKDVAYRLARDGFTLLAMGFTGKKALQFKLGYIDAFNRMEAKLHGGDIDLEQINRAYAFASEVAANTARAAFECMLTGNVDDWRNMRLLVSPVPDGDRSSVRVTRVTNDALVLSLAQLPGYLMDEASMVSNAQLAGWLPRAITSS